MIKKCLTLLCSLISLYAYSSPFVLRNGRQVSVCVKDSEPTVVHTALEMFSNDIQTVFSANVIKGGKKSDVIVRTDTCIGKGRREFFRIEVNEAGQLIVTGSDGRGTAYGLLQVSRLIGVSPWEWWAVSFPVPLDVFTLPEGFSDEQAPSVEYRGIFINDEDVGFMPWATKTYEPITVKGRIGPRTHAKVFELLLRLRANTFWPAMHSCSEPFFLTPGNKEMAAKYGIIIGTSHCEPMVCNVNGEWQRRGSGEYNYFTNRDSVLRFWRQRVEDVNATGVEAVYTLGMRGLHDDPMIGAGAAKEYARSLADVLRDQRDMLSAVKGTAVKAPQVFIPYKEVLDAYRSGLVVPDDVTLLWCDDNYGYLTHLPNSAERRRTGGNGLYYHVSYWGRPQYNTWLGAMSPSVMWQQLHLAYKRGIQRMWILNVGDIKPSEYLMELFLDMAWNINSVSARTIHAHGRRFLEREFGSEAGTRLAPIMEEYGRLTHIMRPEFTDGRRIEEKSKRWQEVADHPQWTESMIRHRLSRFKHLSDMVERIWTMIPYPRRDAYFQLVKYPVQASAQVNLKYLNGQLARHGLAEWGVSDAAHDSIRSLTHTYNKDKWKYMMTEGTRWMRLFNPLRRDTLSSPLPQDNIVAILNASDSRSEGLTPVEGLGYDGGAAEVEKGKNIVFNIPPVSCDSIEVEVRLLPTYPVCGSGLRFMLNGCHIFDYKEEGRTEEWKRNVLRNYAVRSVIIPSMTQLSFMALDEGVVLDQIIIRPR